jgi:hypothetical protein
MVGHGLCVQGGGGRREKERNKKIGMAWMAKLVLAWSESCVYWECFLLYWPSHVHIMEL